MIVVVVFKNDFNISVYIFFFGNLYVVVKLNLIMIEDYVYVKVRIFNGDGLLVNMKSNSVKKLFFVSVIVINISIYYGDDYVIGNYIYKLSGYNDVNYEIKVFW